LGLIGLVKGDRDAEKGFEPEQIINRLSTAGYRVKVLFGNPDILHPDQ
jgi:hypothetical protein